MTVRPQDSSQPARHSNLSRSLVISAFVLLLIVGAGLVWYATEPGATATVTSTRVMTESYTVTKGIIPRATMEAKQFLPQLNQSVHDAWLLFAPSGNGSYVLTVHAEGLTPSQGADVYYVVKGVKVTDSIEQIPIGQTVEKSVLQVDGHGVGSLYIILNYDPSLVYQAIEIVRTSGSATPSTVVVGTASLLPPAAG